MIQIYFLTVTKVRSLKRASQGQGQGAGRAASLLEALDGGTFLPFQLPVATRIPRLAAPSLSSKHITPTQSHHHIVSVDCDPTCLPLIKLPR